MARKNLIPAQGSKGLFKLAAPFDTKLVPKVAYTCQAIRSIRDLVAAGEDPFKDYYEPASLTKQIYDEDVASNVYIVSLQSGVGDWVYVPTTYILSYPDMNGVMYSPTLLGFYLGIVPDSLDLSTLQDDICDLISDTVGINKELIQPEILICGTPTMVSQDDAAVMEASREQNIKTTNTDRSRLLEMTALYEASTQKVQELENYIATKLGISPP